MNRIYLLLCLLLFLSMQSCIRHKRIEIANHSGHDSLMTIVKANGKEIFKGKVAHPHSHFSSEVATFRYRGDSCNIEVDIPELSLSESKSFADLEHDYIVITIGVPTNLQKDISDRKTQVVITAVKIVERGAAE